MNYFVFLLALSSRVLGFEYYENQNLQNFNNFKYPNLKEPNFAEVIYYDELGHGSCPEIKQPLCASNGQHFIYFENPCQLDVRNYEELMEGRYGW